MLAAYRVKSLQAPYGRRPHFTDEATEAQRITAGAGTQGYTGEPHT